MQREVRVNSRAVFDGKIIRVRVDTVRLPDGRETLREVVGHRPAVVIVPEDGEGNVILVRQFRYAVDKELLEAPAGMIEEGEEAQVCAQRELQEETGYRAEDLRALGGFWTGPGFCDEYMHAFLARDLVPSRLEQDYDENILVETVPLSRVPQLIQDGAIQDAKTVAALLMAIHLPERS